MTLIPNRFLFRVVYPCRNVSKIPKEDDERLLDLPEACRIDNFAAMDERLNFADVRLAWNESGLALQAEVRGKDQLLQGDFAKPRTSDGVTLWLDTRDSRGSHRASRHCHQFHFLPTGGGPDHDEPVFVQTKIHRALQDAPICQPARRGFTYQAYQTRLSHRGIRAGPRACTASIRNRILGSVSITLSATRSWVNKY